MAMYVLSHRMTGNNQQFNNREEVGELLQLEKWQERKRTVGKLLMR